MSEPKVNEKRMVRRSVAIALGIVCILLVAGLGGALVYYMNSITELQKIVDLQASTVIVQDYLVGFIPLSPIVVVSNNTVLPSNITYWNSSGFNQIPSYHISIDHAGYIVVNATPSDSIVELEYSSNGLNYDNIVNLGNNTISIFPILPTSTLTILVGSNYSSFPVIMAETVTITYYY